MMTWKSSKQPPYIWHKDIWERTDGMLFISDVSCKHWINKYGDKIKFEDYIIIGQCA